MKHAEKKQPRRTQGVIKKRAAAGIALARFGVAECNLARLGRMLAASFLLGAAGILVACASSSLAVQSGPSLDSGAQWVLLPVANNSDSPQAAEKLEAILATLLRIRGIKDLSVYSPPAESAAVMPVLDDAVRLEQALDWARSRDFKYGITGSIEEWLYKSGVEREPAIGLSLRVVNITTGEVLWSASGARSGWGREPLSGTAQKLASKMLDTAVLHSSSQR